MADASHVRVHARGRWPQLLGRLGVPPQALTNRHGPCPGCGGRDRFRFDDRDGDGTFLCGRGGGEPLAGDGFTLLQHVLGWSFPEAVDAVAGELGLSGAHRPQRRAPVQPLPAVPSRNQANQDVSARIEEALAIWRSCTPIAGTPAETYLVGRGIDPDRLATDPPGWPETLGWCTDADGRGTSALVAAVNDGRHGCVRGVQRIFLHPDGTPVRDQDGKKDKRSRGVIRANAARLSCWPHADGWWGMAEGVETALAARQLTGVPIWAAISSGNMANIQPPHWARHVILFADHDENGAGLQHASKACAALRQLDRIETARVVMADHVGQDAADLLQQEAS